MSIIGEAFVRIRPDTIGFKSETESSVKAAVAGVGKILAGAFAIKGTFDFAKQIVGHAGDVQKQTEAIRAEFGKASDSVLQFADHGAAALGVSAHQAETTAARFGVLAKNVGLTTDQAATVTLGFEKLAGSISQIRNVNPEVLFTNLPLALAGNTRSLRQLGIATDQTQLKIAAFKLGLTNSISQALTPGQKALSIYAVATANLGQFQAQATSHAGDFANVQRRLTANWDNAKDALGRGLLPAMAKVFGFLANDLPGAVKKTVDGFRTFRDDLRALTGPIGGIKGAVEGLIAAFAIGKIVAFAGAIRTDLIANGFAQLQVATRAEQAAYIEAFGTMEIATLGLSSTIKAALISTGIGAIAVAAGIAAELVINHWSKVKAFFATLTSGLVRIFETAWTAIVQAAKTAAYGILSSFTFVIREVLKVASHLPFIGGYAQQALDAIQAEIDLFKPDFGKITQTWNTAGRQAGEGFTKGVKAAFAANDAGNSTKALAGLAKEGFTTDLLTGNTITDKGKLQSAADAAAAETAKAVGSLNDKLRQTIAANTDAITKARASLAQSRQSLADAIRQQGTDVAQAVTDARNNLAQLGQGLANTISTFVDAGPLGQQIKRLQDALTGRQQAQQRKQLVQAVKDAQKQLRDNLAAIGTDPGRNPNEDRAISQFLAPQRQQLDQAKAALADFNTQGKIGSLQTRQQKLKDSIGRGFADLTDEFNKGSINASTFNTRIAALLAKGGINYRNAGKTLGVSFADGFRDQVTTILRQAFAISAGPQLAGVGGTVIRPLEVLRKDQANVAKIQHQIGTQQVTLQTRIAKAAEKTAEQLAKIQSVQLGPSANNLAPPPATVDPRRRRR